MGSQEDAGLATRAEMEPARRAAILTEPAAFLGSHVTQAGLQVWRGDTQHSPGVGTAGCTDRS